MSAPFIANWNEFLARAGINRLDVDANCAGILRLRGDGLRDTVHLICGYNTRRAWLLEYRGDTLAALILSPPHLPRNQPDATFESVSRDLAHRRASAQDAGRRAPPSIDFEPDEEAIAKLRNHERLFGNTPLMVARIRDAQRPTQLTLVRKPYGSCFAVWIKGARNLTEVNLHDEIAPGVDEAIDRFKSMALENGRALLLHGSREWIEEIDHPAVLKRLPLLSPLQYAMDQVHRPADRNKPPAPRFEEVGAAPSRTQRFRLNFRALSALLGG